MAVYQGKKVEIGKPRKIPGLTPKGKKKTVFVYKRGADGKVRVTAEGKKIASPVHFGDASMSDFTKHKNEKRRKNFHARHNCAEKKDKTRPGYYACKYLW